MFILRTRTVAPWAWATPTRPRSPRRCATSATRAMSRGRLCLSPIAGPTVWHELRKVVKEARLKLRLEAIPKWDFYKAVESPDHVLTIQTGDRALWANVLLTMGCRTG